MIPIFSQFRRRRLVPAGGGGSYVSEVLADTPMGYWRLGETSGLAAADASGNGNDGTYQPDLNGNAQWDDPNAQGWTGAIAGDSDKSARFEAGHVALPASSVFIPSANAPITVEAWTNASTSALAGTLSRRAVSLAQTASASRIIIAVGSTNQLQVFWDGTTMNLGSFTVDQWYHVAVAFDGSSRSIYVDGVLAEGPTAAALGIGHSTTAKIGAGVAGAQPWVGPIDEVAIYPSALSAARILAHYNAGA